MNAQEAWLDTIKTHSELVRMRAIVKAAKVISEMPMERILAKFDIGQQEHGDDPATLNAAEEFENEAIDMICYEALLLSRGDE